MDETMQQVSKLRVPEMRPGPLRSTSHGRTLHRHETLWLTSHLHPAPGHRRFVLVSCGLTLPQFLYTPPKVFTLPSSIDFSSLVAVGSSIRASYYPDLHSSFLHPKPSSLFYCCCVPYLIPHAAQPTPKAQWTPFASPFAVRPTNESRDSRTTLVALARPRDTLPHRHPQPRSITGSSGCSLHWLESRPFRA
ncbi:hypothetical protein LIA77_11415 [Sarocladium implicatum]|nr:hypothetical protein LIA77_11415 [Sarocladium implicatum]